MVFETKIRGIGWLVHPMSNVRLPTHPSMPRLLTDAISDGSYERGEAEALLRLVRTGAKILELGGGLGFISALLCKTTKIESYVIVEADSRLLPLINRTHHLNQISNVDIRLGLITADRLALANGRARLALPENFLANSALLINRGYRETVVPVCSLNDLLEELRPDTLIVDIEGSEAGLFKDADLSSVQTILVEVHPELIGMDGCAAVIADILRHGFFQNILETRENVLVFGAREKGHRRTHSPS
jgi:FkbM family methyltransferase